jgi:hypothetical protein
MARQELERRLEELSMSMGDAKGYGQLLTAVQAHIATLHDLLERELLSAWIDAFYRCRVDPPVFFQILLRRRKNVFG